MRWTELTLMPAYFAIIAAVQWVVSAGGSVNVSATTRSATSGPSGGTRDGRVLSRRSPSTPSLMNRACQRQTQGFDLPVRRMIPAVPKPSAVARMMPARHTCFCGLFRSATTASNRARSAALTSTMIPLRIRRDLRTGRPHWESFVRFYPLAGPSFSKVLPGAFGVKRGTDAAKAARGGRQEPEEPGPADRGLQPRSVIGEDELSRIRETELAPFRMICAKN